MGGIRGFRDRLLAERTGGNWVLVLFAEAVLAFALASTLIQFGNAAGPWSAPAAVAGGIVLPGPRRPADRRAPGPLPGLRVPGAGLADRTG